MATEILPQPTEEVPAGDYRSWSIFVPGADVTPGNYTGLWLLGIPTDPEDVELLDQPVTMASVVVRKQSSDGSLQVVPGPGGAFLMFQLKRADTQALEPRFYLGQGWLVDPQGNPVTVARGLVRVTPSLLAANGP